MSPQIKSHDLVISLLPWELHPKIAERCVALSKDMVTASYCTPAMQRLHNKAKEAEVTIVNEVKQHTESNDRYLSCKAEWRSGSVLGP